MASEAPHTVQNECNCRTCCVCGVGTSLRWEFCHPGALWNIINWSVIISTGYIVFFKCKIKEIFYNSPKIVIPKLQISHFCVKCSLAHPFLKSSGAIYMRVPLTPPATGTLLEAPKSQILTTPITTKMFLGLMSKCKTFIECIYSRPLRTLMLMSSILG